MDVDQFNDILHDKNYYNKFGNGDPYGAYGKLIYHCFLYLNKNFSIDWSKVTNVSISKDFPFKGSLIRLSFKDINYSYIRFEITNHFTTDGRLNYNNPDFLYNLGSFVLTDFIY